MVARANKLIPTNLFKKLGKIRWQAFIFLILVIEPTLIPLEQIASASTNSTNAFKDPLQWETYIQGDAQATLGSNLTIITSSKDDVSGASVYSKQKLEGDFIIQVYYNVTGWESNYAGFRNDPHITVAELGICTNESQLKIMHCIYNTNETYTHFLSVNNDTIYSSENLKWEEANASIPGGYRVIRIGKEYNFQYYSDSKWVSYCIISGTEKPVVIKLAASTVWSTHVFSTIFNNIIINENPATKTFKQDGVSANFRGSILLIDGQPLSIIRLPLQLDTEQIHTYDWQSPLTQDYLRYIWMYSSGNPDQAGTTELNDNTTIIAHYKTQFSIEARATPGGQVIPGGVNWYDKGTPLYLNAIPDKGFTFVEWKIETQYVDTKNQSLYIPMLVGGGVITAVFAREPDTIPPTIKLFGLFYPGDVCWSREVKLSAIYSDNVLIDVSSVRLKIDGENVTSGVSVSPSSLWYVDYLSPGSHQLELMLRDIDGNVDSKSQSIMVLPLEFILPIFVAILLVGFVFILRMRMHSTN